MDPSEPIELLDLLRRCGFPFDSIEAGLRADPPRTLDAFLDVARTHPPAFPAELLLRWESAFDAAPRHAMAFLLRLAAHGDRGGPALGIFHRLLRRHPAEGMRRAQELAGEHPDLLSEALVDEVASHIPANPPLAFKTLQRVVVERPELVRHSIVEAVAGRLALAAQHAFPILRRVAQDRVDLAPLCTRALFECVLEEANLYQKRVMIEEIAVLAERSHVRTDLERALRAPLEAGTKAARTLMAVLFRQKLRTRQRVLFEALKQATMPVTVWEFVRFLLDCSAARQVSSAAVEEFLEASYRLRVIAPDEFERILTRTLRVPAGATTTDFPPGVGFLNEDAALVALHRRTALLAERAGASLDLAPIRAFEARAEAAERERAALLARIAAAPEDRRAAMAARERALAERVARWGAGNSTPAERRRLAGEVRDALWAAAVRITLDLLRRSADAAYRAAVTAAFGTYRDVSRVDPAILPAFLYLARLPEGAHRTYLLRLLRDRFDGVPHDWLRTEPPAAAWAGAVSAGQPSIRLERWRAPFSLRYRHRGGDAEADRQRRIRDDLAQTRRLLLSLGVGGLESADRVRLQAEYDALPAVAQAGAAPGILDEIRINLERLRNIEAHPASDFEGEIEFSVEVDPFRYLFMGEYGFASCLSIHGSQFWGAVANAIDIDKAVVWSRDPAGNILGRRLIALTPKGVTSYRTYSNRHGLALDAFFERFIAAYASHCGTGVVRGVRSHALLSERWYDDGVL